jgi:hypothetical protein
MGTLQEISDYISSLTDDILKDYNNKSTENLKELIKRSNQITFYILIITALFLFSSYVKDGSYLGFKVSQDVIKIVSPLLMSYFLLEWCLIARRRRELIKIIKHISFKVYKIKLVNQDYKFTRVGIFNRNVMPFSLMIEVLNIDYDSKIGNFLFRKLFLPFMLLER